MTRHLGLDYLRGVCAICVVIYHFGLWEFSLESLSMGTFTVYMFFTLSSLTMILVYKEDLISSISFEFVARFMANRVARLIPLLFLVSSIMFAGKIVMGRNIYDTITQFIFTASALSGFHLPGFISIAVGSWSLGIEMVFYILFPIIGLLAIRCSTRNLVLVTIALIVMQQGIIHSIKDLDGAQHWYYYTTSAVFAPFFSMGFLISKISVEKRLLFFWMSFGLLIAICFFSSLFDLDVFRHNPSHTCLTILAGLTVYFAFGAEVPKGLVKLARFLGDISYSLYLTHWFTYMSLIKLKATLDGGEYFMIALFPVFSVLLATLTFYFFERPCRDAIRHHMGTRIAVPSRLIT